MRGNDQAIGHLNDALQEELTAVVRCVVDAYMMENFGFKALGDYIMKQAIGKMRHAETLIERILFLEDAPIVDRALAPKIGNNSKAKFQNGRGADYPEPQLVLFSGQTPTACGIGQSAMGPFYWPVDRKVYIDLALYQ